MKTNNKVKIANGIAIKWDILKYYQSCGADPVSMERMDKCLTTFIRKTSKTKTR